MRERCLARHKRDNTHPNPQETKSGEPVNVLSTAPKGGTPKQRLQRRRARGGRQGEATRRQRSAQNLRKKNLRNWGNWAKGAAPSPGLPRLRLFQRMQRFPVHSQPCPGRKGHVLKQFWPSLWAWYLEDPTRPLARQIARERHKTVSEVGRRELAPSS